MDVSTEILRELLLEAGVEPAVALAVRPDVPLLRQGLDSLDFPAFALAVETRFGLVIDERAQLSLRTLDDFAAHILAALQGRPLAPPPGEASRITPGLRYVVEALKPGDGAGVARLFRTVYGEKYPVADYYDPRAIERLNAEGRLLTVVARLEDGDVAGQGAYYQSSPPNKALFEFGQILIDPAYRNTRVAALIVREMERLSRTMDQAQGFYGEAVCNHTTTQRLCGRMDYLECGLELALMPAGAYAGEGVGSLRVSCLLGARVNRDRPGELHLPACYRRRLEGLLDGFNLERRVRFTPPDQPQAAASDLDVRVFDEAGVARVQALRVGADFPERLGALDADALRRGLAVVQVFVNAGAPGAAFAVEALRGRGFILGGFVPLWFGSDGLLLQKLFVAPEFDAIKLHSDRAKGLLADIRREWEQARAGA